MFKGYFYYVVQSNQPEVFIYPAVACHNYATAKYTKQNPEGVEFEKLDPNKDVTSEWYVIRTEVNLAT